MEAVYFEGATFDKIDYSKEGIAKGDYDSCVFTNCEFSKADLSGIKFIECSFMNCNLSLTKIHKTVFREAQFRNCKMLGMGFDTCSHLGLVVSFEDCIVDHSTFFGTRIPNTVFRRTSLQEVDFSGAELNGAVFDECDLRDAKFERTVLDGADFRTARGFSIDPAANSLRRARFSLEGLLGLVGRYGVEVD